jgi:flagellar biogenesis protein FliO
MLDPSSCPSPVPALLEAQAFGGTSGPDLTRYLVVCFGLLALVAALAWGFRRLVGNALRTRAAQRSLQVIDLLPLGGKQRLAVVRCYDRTFLLGLGEKELSSIAELDGSITPLREPAPSRADQRSFAQVLARLRAATPPAAGRPGSGSVLG